MAERLKGPLIALPDSGAINAEFAAITLELPRTKFPSKSFSGVVLRVEVTPSFLTGSILGPGLVCVKGAPNYWWSHCAAEKCRYVVEPTCASMAKEGDNTNHLPLSFCLPSPTDGRRGPSRFHLVRVEFNS